MRLARLRLLATAALLSAPLGVLVCNKAKENSAIEKTANKEIDLQRESLQKQEGELVKKLQNWVRFMQNMDFAIKTPPVEDPLNDPFTQLNFAYQDFMFTQVHIDDATHAITKLKPDFYTEPSKNQIQKFIKLIAKANETAPLVVSNNLEQGELQELSLKGFKIYKDKLEQLALETPKLIQSIAKFNNDAKAASQPRYEPKWGLSLEFLRSLKSIK